MAITDAMGIRLSGKRSDARVRLPFNLTPGAFASMVWIIALVLMALLAPILPMIEPPTATNYSSTLEGPSTEYLLGTDRYGRDMLSRVLYGARASLIVGVGGVVIAIAFGTALGLVAGFLGGITERSVSLLSDTVLAFPRLIILIALTTSLGGGLLTLTVGLGLISVPAFIRLSRASTLQYSQREFVLAARSMGTAQHTIIWRELLPNIMPPVFSYGFIVIAILIVAEGSLSFLGLGIQLPTPSWGNMIAEARPDLASSPFLTFVPAAVMFLTVLAFNFLGDSLMARLNYRDAD